MQRIAKSNMPVVKQSSNLANIVSDSLRTHCVSVRLNNAELIKLNELRGDYAKGECVESITRWAISPREGALKLMLTDFVRLLTLV